MVVGLQIAKAHRGLKLVFSIAIELVRFSGVVAMPRDIDQRRRPVEEDSVIFFIIFHRKAEMVDGAIKMIDLTSEFAKMGEGEA